MYDLDDAAQLVTKVKMTGTAALSAAGAVKLDLKAVSQFWRDHDKCKRKHDG